MEPFENERQQNNIMKNNRYYIIIIIGLIIIALIIFINDRNGTLKTEYSAFSVKDTSLITEIIIKRNKSALILRRTNRKWTVNNNNDINKFAINKLLNCLVNLNISSVVSANEKKEILNHMKDSAIEVCITSNTHNVKKFKLIDSPELNGETIALLYGEEEPYIVHYSGFEKPLSYIFTTNIFVWRDRSVFRYTPQEIISLQIDYFQNKESSFRINFDDSKLSLYPQNSDIKSKVAQNKLINYLMNFKDIPFHWIVPERIKFIHDSLENVTPFCSIQIKDIDNKVNKVSLYRIQSSRTASFDLNKMYAQFQDDSIPVIIKYVDIDPILKEYSDFLP